MTKIYVDADACPVKNEILKVAGRHGLEVYIVSNQWLRVAEGPSVHRVIVEEGADVADKWIAERVVKGDIAITADIPLAARCLENGAEVIGMTGKQFTQDGIGNAVAMRDLMAHLRDRGEVSGGGPAFSKKDRSRFLQTLETTIRAIQRDR